MKEIKKCQGCGVELTFPHKHDENCPYKDGVYPAQCFCGEILYADSIYDCLREEEHGRE